MTNSRSLWLACIVVVATGSVARAQTAPPAIAKKPARIEEIVVTSQRRAQKLQNVPIAVSAFNAATLQSRNVTSTADLIKATPAVQFGQGDLQRNELAIRGIESNRFDAGGEAASATFVDDVYQPRFSNLFLDLTDIQRVEVLEGPQGTLYGRNTIGGAIAIYTPQPSQTFHVSGRVDAGSEGLYGGQVNVTGPITNTVSGELSLGYRDRGGFMKDLTTGRDNGIQSYGGRGKILWQPDDQWKVTLGASLYDNNEDGIIFHRITDQVFLLRPGIDPGVDSNAYENRLTQPTGERVRTSGVSARVDYNGSDVALTSITAYQYTRDDLEDDQDASIYDAFSYHSLSHSNAVSQEFRAASVPSGALSLGGKLTWVGGLFFYQERADEALPFRLGTDDLFTFLAETAGVNVPGGAIIDTTSRAIVTRSYATFGQSTYAITSKLNLTVGARYTVDRKTFTVDDTTNTPGFPLIASDFTTSAGKTWYKFTPKVGLDYHFTPDVMTYVSYARGYQSGTPQSVAFNPVIADKIINPETVATLEAGVKSEFLDHRLRLNVAGYDSDFHNLQVREIVPVAGVPQPLLENAAAARIAGIETSSTIVVTPSLRLDIAYNYIDAHYKTYIPQPGVDDTGNRLPRAPRHTATASATYRINLPNDAQLALTGTEYVTTKVYFQPDDLPNEVQSGYATTDANVTYSAPSGKWRASGWIKDMFDQKYRTYVELNAPSGREIWGDRRTFGFTLYYDL